MSSVSRDPRLEEADAAPVRSPDAEREVVRPYIVEVSAEGLSTGSGPPARTMALRRRRRRLSLPRDERRSGAESSPAALDAWPTEFAEAASSRSDVLDDRRLSIDASRRAGRKGRGRGRLPAWATSLLMHAVGISAVGVMTVALPVAEDALLETSVLQVEEVDFSDFDPPPADDASANAELELDDLMDAGEAAAGDLAEDLAIDAALDDLAADPGLPGGALSDVESLFGSNAGVGPGGEGMGGGGAPGGGGGKGGTGRGSFGTGLGGDPLAKFFGTKIEGQRIVFVLDNSGSMQEGRLETVIAELLRCVDSLGPKQEFYVIFHSDAVYPLFYPEPVAQYIRPSDQNKRLLADWLDTVELCLGDTVDEAVAAAMMIEPDTVLLLSDGRHQGTRTMQFLLAGEGRSFPMHTFGVGMGGSVAGRRNLADIAAANGGEFRETQVADDMREQARKQPRPYHVDRPGLVWGRNVRPRR